MEPSFKPTVVEWLSSPRMDGGSPEPAILAGRDLLIAYRVAEPRADSSDAVGVLQPTLASGEVWGIIRFESYIQIRYGYPNDEVLEGHPLFHAGLRSYAIQEIVNSPWVDELAKQNEVHSRNSRALWDGYKHWLFAFHDETLEVLSDVEPEIFSEVAPSAALAIAARIFNNKES